MSLAKCCSIVFAVCHFNFFRYTAVSVLEMDFDRIDINQCPKGQGNNGPNRFADSARCKKDTTEVNITYFLLFTNVSNQMMSVCLFLNHAKSIRKTYLKLSLNIAS